MKKKKELDNIHVIYSEACRKLLVERIAAHYPQVEREEIFAEVHNQYMKFLSSWNRDLGGKKNFHNGEGGTYDCIAFMSYYKVCRSVTSLQEIEKMEEDLILPSFRNLKFVNCNKPFWRKLMYRAFLNAEKQCNKWNDYKMKVEPYDKNKPIRYAFTSCPVAEFALQNCIAEVMPALCNVDYVSMELLHARLIRTETCADGKKCDYVICGDKDPYVNDHPEYRDEAGYRKNR